VIDEDIIRDAVDRYRQRYALTPRERDILEQLIDDGATNIDIGKRLYLSEKTVKFHLGRAMRKLGATNRTHLALLYVRQQEKEAS
jgi:DNA-binding CsgD family transcriptional regulator